MTNVTSSVDIPTALIVGGSAVAIPCAAATAAGFGAAGIAVNSLAAMYQATVSSVAAGSVFATMQSLGATGMLSAGSTAGGLTAAAGAITKWWKKSENNSDEKADDSLSVKDKSKTPPEDSKDGKPQEGSKTSTKEDKDDNSMNMESHDEVTGTTSNVDIPTALIVGGSAVAIPCAAATAAGFGAAGIAVNSLAAMYQATVSSVAAGSAFATMQSLGATGMLSAGSTAGGLTAVAGAVTKWWKKSKNNSEVIVPIENVLEESKDSKEQAAEK